LVVIATMVWWQAPKRQANLLSLKIRDPKARADVEDNFRKTIGQLLGDAAVLIGTGFAYYQTQLDTSAFLPLPPAPYDACHKVATRVSSLSLVRYRNNDYSVPTRHGHQEVLAVDRVEIACRGETIATHVRS
jgi:hypothetical protein